METKNQPTTQDLLIEITGYLGIIETLNNSFFEDLNVKASPELADLPLKYKLISDNIKERLSQIEKTIINAN